MGTGVVSEKTPSPYPPRAAQPGLVYDLFVKPYIDGFTDNILGAAACGLYYEHLADYLMLTEGWAYSFGHCYAHCKIAQNCGEHAQEVSKAIGTYTETIDSAACVALIAKVGQCLACKTDVCKSAWQQSDFKDNQKGFEEGSKNPDGDCESMCQQALGYKMKDDEGAEEGPDTRRPYGPFCPERK